MNDLAPQLLALVRRFKEGSKAVRVTWHVGNARRSIDDDEQKPAAAGANLSARSGARSKSLLRRPATIRTS